MPTFEPERSRMNTAKLWIGLFITAAVYWSCSKGGSGANPSISLKSVNTTVVIPDTTLLTFTFDLKEKSYNPNDTLYVIIQRFLNVPGANCDALIDTLAFNMVSLAQGVPTTTGSNFSASMQVSFANGSTWAAQGYPDIEDHASIPCYVGATYIQDTAQFSFVLGSNGHFSDTVHSTPIIILHD